MKTPFAVSDARSRHRLIALVAALLAIVVLAGVGVYGLLTGPPPTSDRDPDHDGGTRPGPVVTTPGDPAPTGTQRLPEVEASDDPETFTRNVAEALFAWDTSSGLMPLD